MIINNNLSLFNFSQKQQTKPAFKAADYFQPIKNHSKMICGCCGKKTLPITKYMQAVTRLGLSLKVQIEKGVLDYLKDGFPRTWEKLVSLSAMYPLESLDKILHGQGSQVNDKYIELKQSVVEDIEENEEIKNLSKPAKNKHIRKIFFDLNDNARTYMKPSQDVFSVIKPLKIYLSEAKKGFFEQMEEYSRKFPDKSLSEIIREPELIEFHRNNLNLQDIETRKRRNFHFRNILTMVETSAPFSVEAFKEIQKQALKVIYTEKDDKKKEYILKKLYQEALEKYHCDTVNVENVNKELKEIAKNSPSSDYFFVKSFNKNLSDSEIIRLLFEDLLASKRNILSDEENGIENIFEDNNDSILNKKTGDSAFGNHYVMCRECNTKTSNDSLNEIVKYETQAPKNIQEQINIITAEILNGSLDPKFRALPIYIAENFRKVSGGAVNLDIIDYCEEILKRSKGRIQANSSYKRHNCFTPAQIKHVEKIESILQKKLTDFLEKNKKTT